MQASGAKQLETVPVRLFRAPQSHSAERYRKPERPRRCRADAGVPVASPVLILPASEQRPFKRLRFLLCAIPLDP